jgi:hypothetical protein
VDAASDGELLDLVRAADEAEADFWTWLAGPESFSRSPTPEYVALTNLTMAAESARIELRQRGSKSLDAPRLSR